MLIVAALMIGLIPLFAVALEVLRAIIHRRRERRNGLGGTQDIAMWGTLVMFLWIIASLTCLGIAFDRGELPLR